MLATAARDTYLGEATDDKAAALHAINEMLIVVLKQLAASVAEDAARYPDDAFFATLYDQARDPKPAQALRWALTRVLTELAPDSL